MKTPWCVIVPLVLALAALAWVSPGRAEQAVWLGPGALTAGDCLSEDFRDLCGAWVTGYLSGYPPSRDNPGWAAQRDWEGLVACWAAYPQQPMRECVFDYL